MNWIRTFSAQEGNVPPARNVEDAPRGMRQEFVDLAFGLVEQQPGVLDDDHLCKVICQTLGVQASGVPYGGPRYAAGRDLSKADWSRVYDLIVRLWPEFQRLNLQRDYREGVNRILAAYEVA